MASGLFNGSTSLWGGFGSVWGGRSGLQASAGFDPLSPINTVRPAITGTGAVGSTETASTGSWTNSPTGFSYLWSRNGVAISGATASTYVTASLDNGATLTVTVTALNTGHPSGVATSVGVAITAPGGTLQFNTPSNFIYSQMLQAA